MAARFRRVHGRRMMYMYSVHGVMKDSGERVQAVNVQNCVLGKLNVKV